MLWMQKKGNKVLLKDFLDKETMMATTPLQKCAMNLQQRYALEGKNITTAQAVKQCSKKFPVSLKKKEGKGLGNKSRTNK